MPSGEQVFDLRLFSHEVVEQREFRYPRRDAGIAKKAEVEREERELNGDVTTPFEQS